MIDVTKQRFIKCGETTHIPQISNSTSLHTGKNYRERIALIENGNTAEILVVD